MPQPKLSQAQRQEIARRFVAGEKQITLAEEFSVAKNTIIRVCRDLHAVRPPAAATKPRDIKEFAKRAKSILWGMDSGQPEAHKNFNDWKARVATLTSKSGLGLSMGKAVVKASKDWPSLNRLFREFDVQEFDDDSVPAAQPGPPTGARPKRAEVECEGIVQTYRESLRWALGAAGELERTGNHPTVCPCNDAWYLYTVAISDSKDFLGKVSQVEAKGDVESADKRNARLAGDRSIAEIDGMLAELDAEGESDES